MDTYTNKPSKCWIRVPEQDYGECLVFGPPEDSLGPVKHIIPPLGRGIYIVRARMGNRQL